MNMNTMTTVALEAAPGFNLMDLMPIVLMVLMLAGLYFLMILPQKKKEKKLKQQLNELSVGDSVVTIGGIVGTVANVKDDEVTISTSIAHTMITFNKSAINTIIKRD